MNAVIFKRILAQAQASKRMYINPATKSKYRKARRGNLEIRVRAMSGAIYQVIVDDKMIAYCDGPNLIFLGDVPPEIISIIQACR